MTKQDERTAKIYQFPAGGRNGLTARAGIISAPAYVSGKPVEVASGGAWYHDEAIRQADRASQK